MSEDLVFVLPGLERSGGYRTLCEWANRSAMQGRRTTVVSPARGPGTAYLDPEVTVVTSGPATRAALALALRGSRPFGRRAELTLYPWSVRRLIPDAADVVLGFVPWQPSLPARPMMRYCQHWEPVWFEDGSAAQRRAQEAMALPGPTIVNSSWLRAQFPQAARSSLRLVHPGVDLEVFTPDGPTEHADVPPRLRGHVRCVALGRHDVPWKGGRELMTALARAWDVELCLYGTADVAEEPRPWGMERRLGALAPDTLARLLRSADLVVTPSWYESFPLPPLEAMACGTAVITTRAGTEDYAADGVNALVVEGKDPAALAGAIVTLLRDPSYRQRLADGGLETAQRFTWAAGFAQFSQAMGWG